MIRVIIVIKRMAGVKAHAEQILVLNQVYNGGQLRKAPAKLEEARKKQAKAAAKLLAFVHAK